jgi:tripartite-type tricarboxylate transporter receptor subunit TctC
MLIPPLIISQHIKAGRVRAVAYSGAKRLEGLPEVPLISEAGLPGFQMDTGWHAWFAPAKTPPAVINKLYGALRKVLDMPKMKEYFVSIGYEVAGDTPAQFQKIFEVDKKRWGEIARLAKVTAE